MGRGPGKGFFQTFPGRQGPAGTADLDRKPGSVQPLRYGRPNHRAVRADAAATDGAPASVEPGLQKAAGQNGRMTRPAAAHCHRLPDREATLVAKPELIRPYFPRNQKQKFRFPRHRNHTAGLPGTQRPLFPRPASGDSAKRFPLRRMLGDCRRKSAPLPHTDRSDFQIHGKVQHFLGLQPADGTCFALSLTKAAASHERGVR